MEQPNGLTAEGICKIIKACKASDVKELRYGELTVNFVSKHPEPEFCPIDTPILVENEELETKIDSETFDELEQDHKDRYVTELLIEDPLAYEDLAANGELENAEQVS